MTTSTGNLSAEPLAALSARVMRNSLRLASDTLRWVQRAAHPLPRTPAPTIGASIEAFSAGIAQRFPDVAARFTTPGDAAESYAAIDMPFVSAQGLVEVAEEETPAFESTTALLAQMRGTQSAIATNQPISSPSTPTVRTARSNNATASANATQSSLEGMQARSAATQTPASPAPLQRKAAPATSDVRSKAARVISTFEEVPRKNGETSASLPEVTRAPAQEMPIAQSAHSMPQAEMQVPEASSDKDTAVVSPEDLPVAPPAMQRSEVPAGAVPQAVKMRSAPAIQRKSATPPVMQRQDDTAQPHHAESQQAVTQSAPAIQRLAQAQPVATPTPQREATAAPRIASSPALATAPLHVAAEQRTISQNNAGNQPAALPLHKTVPAVSPPQVQRRVDPTVAPLTIEKSSPSALPILHKAHVPQLARAGQSAQQTSHRIARMASPSPSLPSALPMSNFAAGMDDDAAAMTNVTAMDRWPALPSVAASVPSISDAMSPAPFAMPAFDMPSVPQNIAMPSMRAALPQTPAMPQLDMPFAPARNAAQNMAAAAQSQAGETFAALPNMPAMPSLPALPSLQGAASQLQTSAGAAMAGGVNAASSAMQSGVAGAKQIANGAVSAAQGALGALNAGTPKTDLDKLARQLLPHLKRMLALERERMRPF